MAYSLNDLTQVKFDYVLSNHFKPEDKSKENGTIHLYREKIGKNGYEI